MFELTTDRLRLIPLDFENLLLLKESRKDMESNLGLEHSGLSFSGEYRDIRAETFEFWLENVQDVETDYRWHTNWEVVLKDENRSIGGTSFLGAPNRKGEVILGYIVDSGYRNYGYMSEAVNAITEWALAQDGVARVISFVEQDSKNLEAVERLLDKCGFRKEVIYVKQ